MAGSGSAIRGSRIGAAPSRGVGSYVELAPRQEVTYHCADGHETVTVFVSSADVEIPDLWDCATCGNQAARYVEQAPAPQRTLPFKSHLDYVKERRSDVEGQALLAEALEALRQRRPLR